MILRIKNEQGEWVEIPALVGPQGEQGIQGEKGLTGPAGNDGPQGPAGNDGAPGKDYVITEADYNAIADVVLTKLPTAEGGSY